MSDPLNVSISPNAISTLWCISPIGGITNPAINSRTPNAHRTTDNISCNLFIILLGFISRALRVGVQSVAACPVLSTFDFRLSTKPLTRCWSPRRRDAIHTCAGYRTRFGSWTPTGLAPVWLGLSCVVPRLKPLVPNRCDIASRRRWQGSSVCRRWWCNWVWMRFGVRIRLGGIYWYVRGFFLQGKNILLVPFLLGNGLRCKRLCAFGGLCRFASYILVKGRHIRCFAAISSMPWEGVRV